MSNLGLFVLSPVSRYYGCIQSKENQSTFFFLHHLPTYTIYRWNLNVLKF